MISFGQSIIECIVHNFILVHEIGSGEMQISNVLFICIIYFYIQIVFLYVLTLSRQESYFPDVEVGNH